MPVSNPRTIRSFVRRSGRLTPAQARALEEFWPRYGVDCPDGKLDLERLFGCVSERVLEIGFGNGESLIQLAAANPDLDYLGVEVHKPGVGHCLLLAAQAEIANLRVICGDAITVMQENLADATFCRINLYFPDPWPKKRHHKRRILQPGFLVLAGQKLRPGGSLHLATDWAGYADHIDELIAGQRLFELAERRSHSGENALDRPMTKFEKRGLREGHRIYDWSLRRI